MTSTNFTVEARNRFALLPSDNHGRILPCAIRAHETRRRNDVESIPAGSVARPVAGSIVRTNV
jgi:hypothetical protein